LLRLLFTIVTSLFDRGQTLKPKKPKKPKNLKTFCKQPMLFPALCAIERAITVKRYVITVLVTADSNNSVT